MSLTLDPLFEQECFNQPTPSSFQHTPQVNKDTDTKVAELDEKLKAVSASSDAKLVAATARLADAETQVGGGGAHPSAPACIPDLEGSEEEGVCMGCRSGEAHPLTPRRHGIGSCVLLWLFPINSLQFPSILSFCLPNAPPLHAPLHNCRLCSRSRRLRSS